jgi:hypothetical protein
MCDEALSASLLNVLHFLRLTHGDLVLDYACHVLDDRLVTTGELFTDIRLHKRRLVIALFDRLDVCRLTVPQLLVSRDAIILLELLSCGQLYLLEADRIQVKHLFVELVDLRGISQRL